MDAKEARLRTAILIVTIILGIIVILFFISLIRQQRRNLKLQRESRQVEVNALEKDRKRMANDLHDELSPMVAAIKMGINNFELSSPGNSLLLEKTNDIINNLSLRMREISFNLMPSTLLRKGLKRALEELASHINSNSSLRVQLLIEDISDHSFPEEKEVNIYRIMQEIVHNTLKHAHAGKLKIRMYRDKKYLVITSLDDGTGFNYEKLLKESNGLGLKSIESRVDLLDGEVTVESKEGRGTVYTIIIPF
jgi:two-component system, NarL family, sensor kinase